MVLDRILLMKNNKQFIMINHSLIKPFSIHNIKIKKNVFKVKKTTNRILKVYQMIFIVIMINLIIISKKININKITSQIN